MNTLDLYTDYVSNPKSDKWNHPDYKVKVIYGCTNQETKETKYTRIKVKTLNYAKELIEFWNACGDGWHYWIVIHSLPTVDTESTD